jgi:hypothetical protein
VTLNNGGLEDSVRTGVLDEIARTITFLSNITSIKSKAKDKRPYQLMFGSKPKVPTSLRIFGEMGVVTTKDDIQGKLKNHSLTCMLVGYSVDHANNVYRMLNLNSKSIIQTRDVVWLEKCYNDRRKNKTPSNDNDKDEDIRDYIEEYLTLNTKESIIEKDQLAQEVNQKTKRKAYRELKHLESSYNPDVTRIVNDIDQGRDIILNQANIGLFNGATKFEPKNFEQAWNHNDAKNREKWRMAITKEFNDIDSKKFWNTVK